MTLEQLRIFIAVAEREHVTRAAEALHLTQSAVSAAIAALENRYRVALFHRVGRRIELSAEGKLFLGEARAVLAQAEAAERTLADLSGLRRGSLAVEASQTIASHWLPSRLVAFRRIHPDINVGLAVGNTLQVAKAVREGVAELGFVEGHIDEPALALTEVDRDRLVIVVAPDHPWARKAKLRAADLVTSEWVLREAGSGTRSEFAAALRTYDIPETALDIALELPSNDAVRAAVEAGLGATAISELAAASGLQSGALVRAKFNLPARIFNMLLHGARYQSRAAQAFVAMITGKT
jgi:DNA-binding transcriptional LysR family regulator